MDTGKVDHLIFGIHPVQEALQSGRKLERLYVSRGRKGKAIADILFMAKSQGIDVRFEPYESLTARLQGKLGASSGNVPSHQGVVGITTTYVYPSFEELLSTAQQQQEPPFLLVLDQIQDPHNLGAILRSAECAGAHGVIIPKRRSAEITPTVMKVSAGASAYIPVCRVTNLAMTIEDLKKRGIWVVGTASVAQLRYTDVDLTMANAIVIGNEEKGLRRLVAEKCDLLVSIPLYGKISALNASVASAILMFEVRRQRRAKSVE